MSLTDDGAPGIIDQAAQSIHEADAAVTEAVMSIADRIWAADDIDSSLLEVPEWGVTLELRSPTGAERSELQKMFVDMERSQAAGEVVMRDLKTMWPALVITCCYDPATGERAFEMTPATMAALNRKNGAVLERVAQACMPLVGLTPADVDEKKAPSSTTPSSESPTS